MTRNVKTTFFKSFLAIFKEMYKKLHTGMKDMKFYR